MIAQRSFDGMSVPADVQQACICVLEEHPEARGDNKLAMYLVISEHFDVTQGMCVHCAEQLERNMTARSFPSLKTVWNRLQDAWKKYRPDLAPSADVQERYQRQATQGPVR